MSLWYLGESNRLYASPFTKHENQFLGWRGGVSHFISGLCSPLGLGLFGGWRVMGGVIRWLSSTHMQYGQKNVLVCTKWGTKQVLGHPVMKPLFVCAKKYWDTLMDSHLSSLCAFRQHVQKYWDTWSLHLECISGKSLNFCGKKKCWCYVAITPDVKLEGNESLFPQLAFFRAGFVGRRMQHRLINWLSAALQPRLQFICSINQEGCITK